MDSKDPPLQTDDTLSLLGIAFIVLKLCGVIDWSWWWVLAPVWMPYALAITIVIAAIPFIFLSERRKALR